MTRVKVCGVTRAEDARLAVELGASAVGFVFWPDSPRATTPAAVRAIVGQLPAFVASVGVFVNQPADEVLEIAGRAGIGVIQLHGDENPADYAGHGFQIVKAVAVDDAFTPSRLDLVPAEATVLLDAHDPVRRGGTGRTIDWSLAASAARRRPVILSGGLTPGNVQEALRRVRPHALDVASGVESAPGIKDSSRLRAFFAAVAT